MPTAAKLVAAICMAISSMIIIMITIDTYSDVERHADSMYITGGLVGLVVGWRNLGKIVLTDEGSGAISGLRAGTTAVLLVLVVFSINVMIEGMLKHAYFEPMAAILQIPLNVILFGKMGLTLAISGSIVALSIGSGIAAKRASQRWV